MKVACFSVACVDTFKNHSGFYPGGNAFNQCINFKLLDFDTAMIGAIGDDANGQLIAEQLRKHQVDTSHLHVLRGETASNQLYNDVHGERFGVEGAWKNGVYGTYRFNDSDWEFIKGCEVWSTHVNCPEFETALDRKRNHHFIAVDFLHFECTDHYLNYLDKVDIAYFGGTPEMAPTLAQVAKSRKTLIVLTLGSEGSLAFHGNQQYQQKALPVEKVVDTTGCGDAFQSAFTASYLKNHDISLALLAGAESGRKTTQHLGAIRLI